MAKPITTKASEAESKGAAMTLADGKITEQHPGTDFTPLNDNDQAGNGIIEDENSTHGTSTTAKDLTIGLNTLGKLVQSTSTVEATTPKKRGSVGEDGPAAKKKRLSLEGVDRNMKQVDAEVGSCPSTPPPKRGRGRPAKTPDVTKTPDGSGNAAGVTSSSDSTQAPGSASTAATSIVSPTSRLAKSKQNKRSALAGSIVKGRGIPTSLAEASEADRAMLRMREENKTWIEINSMWEAMTGEKPGKSTLPNRFARLKANLMSLEKGDADRLLRAKAAVEKRLELEKWNMIRDAMKEDGSKADYSTAFLQKESKKLVAAGEQVMGDQTTSAGAGRSGIKSEDEDEDEDGEK